MLSLHRVSDTRLASMEDGSAGTHEEEKHKTEIRHRTRSVLAFLKYVPESDIDMESYIDPLHNLRVYKKKKDDD